MLKQTIETFNTLKSSLKVYKCDENIDDASERVGASFIEVKETTDFVNTIKKTSEKSHAMFRLYT